MIFLCVDVHVVGLPINHVIVLVQEEEQWLFLSRKASVRKRSLKHLVDEAHCLQSEAIHHNITGQYDRKKCFLCEKKKRPRLTSILVSLLKIKEINFLSHKVLFDCDIVTHMCLYGSSRNIR